MATTQTYRNRRLLLMGLLLLLGIAAGFVWGRMIGYEQGKADMVKMIEEKLTRRSCDVIFCYRATKAAFS